MMTSATRSKVTTPCWWTSRSVLPDVFVCVCECAVWPKRAPLERLLCAQYSTREQCGEWALRNSVASKNRRNPTNGINTVVPAFLCTVLVTCSHPTRSAGTLAGVHGHPCTRFERDWLLPTALLPYGRRARWHTTTLPRISRHHRLDLNHRDGAVANGVLVHAASRLEIPAPLEGQSHSW